jgi:para-nitrobenzyl esterase
LIKAQTVAELKAAADRLYGDKAKKFLTLYPASTDAQARVVAAQAVRDAGSGVQGAWQWAEAQSRFGQAPVFLYKFSHVQPFNPAIVIADHPERIGAYHTSDVPYWFQTLDALNLFRPTRLWTEADRSLARDMTSILISFAKTGRPDVASIDWPAWTLVSPRLLDIGSTGRTFRVDPMNRSRLEFQALNPPAKQPRRRAARD